MELTSAEKAKANYLLKTFKQTLEEHNALRKEQNNACAICKRPFTEYKAYQDHDHDCCAAPRRKVGKYCGKCNRGLLCFLCNKKVVAAIEQWAKWGIDPHVAIAYIVHWTEVIKAKGGYAPKEDKPKTTRRVSKKQTGVRQRSTTRKTNRKTVVEAQPSNQS